MQDMTPDEIQHFLGDARIGRLCLSDCDGRPYAIPLPFCSHDRALYVRVPLTGRKGQILGENDRVCFEADAFTDALDNYTSVLVEGRLVAVTDPDEKQRVKQANDEKYRRLRGGHRPGHSRARPAAELPLRKIHVEQIGGRRREHRRREGPTVAATGAIAARVAEGATRPR